MKHFSKKLSWLLAFVLIFTSLVSTGIPVYASDRILIDQNTQDVLIPTGTEVDSPYRTVICYYESADSNNILYCDTSAYIIGTYDIENMALKTSAWRITYLETVTLNDSSGSTACVFKAYPDTSIENLTVGSTMAFPEGTTLTTTGSAINVSIYVDDTKLGEDSTASSNYTLPSASDLASLVGESEFNSALAAKGYHLPDLTKLYYTVEFTDKSTIPYSLKITLVPTVEVTFDENTGTPDLDGTKMYATFKGPIDSTKLPTASLADKDFYGWYNTDNSYYAYFEDVADAYLTYLRPVNSTTVLKAMYQEKKPDFRLDLTNKKVTNLHKNRSYDYSKYGGSISTDDNGEFSYESIWGSELRLNSNNEDTTVHSDFVSLKHSTPNKPVVEYTATTARITNTSEYTGCEFAIRATSDYYGKLNWVDSFSFTGLTPETEYNIFVRHKADENGFESNEAESLAFTLLAVKAVSNEAPNGVTVAAIPDQTHTGSAIEPTLLIKDGDKTLVQGTDYSVAYTDNTNVGTAIATVTFSNDYSGNMTKNFNIVSYKLVSFVGNGGSGTMSNVSVIDGQQYTLPACTFTAPANMTFKSWNIGGTEYAVGAILTINTDTTVIAVWKELVKDPEKVETPVISPNGGTFSGSQTVTLSTETAAATIYYTIDGTVPTTESLVYSEPFTISSSMTVKAFAVKDGMTGSDIASASFTKSSSNSGGSTPPTNTTSTNTAPTNTTPTNTTPTKVEPTPAEKSKNEFVLTIGKKEAEAFGEEKTNDVAPIVKNDRTMLPARFIAESLGAEVIWNGKKREVKIRGKNIKGEEVEILLYIGSDIAYVNGKEVKLESPAFIENGRTYTPIGFIAENLGAKVEWIQAEQKVVITKKDN